MNYLISKYFPNTTEQYQVKNTFSNQALLDSIIDDDDEKFIDIISQYLSVDSNPNQVFQLSSYKLPYILQHKPTFASLCAFFGSEKCFSYLSSLLPNGCESDEMKKLDDNNLSLVHFACAGGNLNILRQLDQAGYDLNAPDIFNFIPSCYAAIFGQLSVLRYLWTKGAEIITCRLFNMCPVTFEMACLYGNLNIVKFLYEVVFPSLDLTSQKLLLSGSEYYGLMPMHYACTSGNSDLVEYLLSIDEIKAQLDIFDQKGRNPISYAYMFGSLNVIKLLMKSVKIDLHPRKKYHLPLIEAASNGHADIVNFLIKLDNSLIFEEDSNHFNPLQVAIMNNHSNIVDILLQNGATFKYDYNDIGDLFLLACQSNSLNIAKILDKKLNIPYHMLQIKKDSFIKKTGISLSNITWGDQFMKQACICENIEFVLFLLEKNCNFNKVNFSHNVTRDWSPFLDFLNKKRFDLPKNCEDYTDRLITEIISTGNIKRVKIMISKGLELNKEIISKYNCISKVCDKGNVTLFNFLLKYHPVINDFSESIFICIRNASQKRNIKNYLVLIDKLLDMKKIDFSDSWIKRSTIWAAKYNLFDVFDIFLKHGIDFTHYPLNCSYMKTTNHLKVYKFLEDHGCIFDNCFGGYNVIKCDSALQSLFYDIYTAINSQIIDFLLQYSTVDNILNVNNERGNIIDNLMQMKNYQLILKIYQKCNFVIMPVRTSEKDFINLIRNSNNDQLINFVSNYNPN